MRNNNSNLDAETELVKEVYATLNRNDIPAALKLFDPQILRIEYLGPPPARTVRGLEEMQAHLIQGRDTWAEGGCTPEEFITKKNKIIALVYVRVRLKNNTEWLEGRVADAYAFKNGKITEMHTFPEKQQALDWAGIKS